MKEEHDIRWKQRLVNFRKANRLVREGIAIENPSEIERMGLIQAFEVTVELGWKLMLDYLKEQQWPDRSPRDVVKRSVQVGLVNDGESWLRALTHRNQTSHTYDEKTVDEFETAIRGSYIELFDDLEQKFQSFTTS